MYSFKAVLLLLLLVLAQHGVRSMPFSFVALLLLQDLKARRSELQSLDTSRFNPLSALGHHMPDLVREIRQQAAKVR